MNKTSLRFGQRKLQREKYRAPMGAIVAIAFGCIYAILSFMFLMNEPNSVRHADSSHLISFATLLMALGSCLLGYWIIVLHRKIWIKQSKCCPTCKQSVKKGEMLSANTRRFY